MNGHVEGDNYHLVAELLSRNDEASITGSFDTLFLFLSNRLWSLFLAFFSPFFVAFFRRPKMQIFGDCPHETARSLTIVHRVSEHAGRRYSGQQLREGTS